MYTHALRRKSLFITFALLISFMFAPALTSAHDDHVSFAQVAPQRLGPPPGGGAPDATDRAALESRLALLLQLLDLLRAQLALKTGGSVDTVVSTNTGEPSGNDGTSTSNTDYEDYLTGIGNATITWDDTYRYIEGNGLPNYTITGDNFAHNESAQNIDLRVPLNPALNNSPCLLYTSPSPRDV